MKQVSGRQLAVIIQRRGWTLSRVNGSHHIFTLTGRTERVVVPIHGNQSLKIGLLRALMKVAGLEEKDL